MRPRLIIPLLLIVALPLATLTWWGVRMVKTQQDALEHQLQTLVDTQLQEVQDTITLYFLGQQTRLTEDAQSLITETTALRAYLRQQPWVRQVFAMDAEGERLHPPLERPLNEEERRFLQRSAMMWTDKDLLQASINASSEPIVVTRQQESSAKILDYLGSSRSQQAPTQTAEAETAQTSGWYTWYSEAGMNLIFWWRNNAGQLIGFELDPVRMAADIITVLPETRSGNANPGSTMLRVVDERDTVVYQWGAYRPAEQEQRLALLPLKHPLGSWKLEYFGNRASQGVQSLGLLASILAIACTLGILAWYLYREHSRELRLASQRVNFVNQVSHELKTPLTNIRMYAEMLDDQVESLPEDNHAERSKLQRYSEIITNESQRLSRLIGNVLSFSQSQRGKLKFHPQTTTADEVIEKTLTAFGPALSAKNIRINFQGNASTPASIDPDILEQILNNLISNVEKYAASGGLLEITSSQSVDTVAIRVQDNGPGIPRREQNRIFEAFHRISDAVTEGVSGAGIGLSIAHQLAGLHGGDLTLVPGNHGACFQITLHAQGADPRKVTTERITP